MIQHYPCVLRVRTNDAWLAGNHSLVAHVDAIEIAIQKVSATENDSPIDSPQDGVRHRNVDEQPDTGHCANVVP